ncbi:unnamed protein product, partial [Mesorhabditis belari]|uniref:Uncharacterized protein n=1 Tax=Mesorhabditis belari TaxID=2138241 RepID=A0AAF3JBY8_9BILA
MCLLFVMSLFLIVIGKPSNHHLSTVPCGISFALTEKDPNLILHGEYLREINAERLRICVNTFTNYTFVVDQARICDSLENRITEACGDSAPFFINQQPFRGHCKGGERARDHYSTCRSVYNESQLILQINRDFYTRIDTLAISFRVSEWIDESVEYSLELAHSHYNPMIVNITKFQTAKTALWLVLALHTRKTLKILTELKSNRSNSNCTYELLSGPPPGKNQSYNERRLMSFRDNTELIPQHLQSLVYSLHIASSITFYRDDIELIPQHLQSLVYSLHIARGCAPNVVIKPDFHWEDLDTDKSGWMNERQELCDGSVFVATQGYANQFELIENGYNLDYRIECEYPINIVVEVIAVLTSELSIDFERRVLVLLGHPKISDDSFVALVEPEALVTLLTHPTFHELQNIRVNTEILIEDHASKYANPLNRCQNLWPELKCDQLTSYYTYAGSQTGIDQNGIKLNRDSSRTLRSSVTTIFANKSCSFCLSYRFEKESSNYRTWESTGATLMVSSYEYPWRFDEPDKYAAECMRLRYAFFVDATVWTETQMEIISLENGRLNVSGYPVDPGDRFSCTHTTKCFEKIITDNTFNLTLDFRAMCFMNQREITDCLNMNPIAIDGEMPIFESCKKTFRQGENQTLESCRMKVTSQKSLKLMLNPMPESESDYSAIAIRVAEWIDVEQDFRLELMVNLIEPTAFRVEKAERETWIGLALLNGWILKHLRKLRWVSGKCSME